MSDPAWMKKVFVTPDLLPKEQQQNKELRKQVAYLNGSNWLEIPDKKTELSYVRREGSKTDFNCTVTDFNSTKMFLLFKKTYKINIK